MKNIFWTSLFANLTFFLSPKKFNSTRDLVYFIALSYMWSLFVFIFWIYFFYFSKNLENYSIIMPLIIVGSLLSFLSFLYNIAYLKTDTMLHLYNLNLHIGDKIDFIEGKSKKEGELIGIYYSASFGFEYKIDNTVGIMSWLYFIERRNNEFIPI